MGSVEPSRQRGGDRNGQKATGITMNGRPVFTLG